MKFAGVQAIAAAGTPQTLDAGTDYVGEIFIQFPALKHDGTAQPAGQLFIGNSTLNKTSGAGVMWAGQPGDSFLLPIGGPGRKLSDFFADADNTGAEFYVTGF